MTVKHKLQELLKVMWLRPESALWYSHMLFLADKFLGRSFEHPSIEYGCMDGINTVILLGGEFNDWFDMYNEVSWNKQSHLQPTLKDDFFNTIKDIDLSDIVKTRSDRYFKYGIDWKDAHIEKAARLGVYKECIKTDLAVPKLPFENNYLKTIWAPNLYWSKNFNVTLSELVRVLNKNGRIITIAPDVRQLEYMFYRLVNDQNRSWLQSLDRGRFENASRNARTYKQFEEIFIRNGLRIIRHERFISPLIAKVYDIGFRPMFPVFMNMYEKLKHHSPGDLLDLKKHWIETVLYFFSPLCDVASQDAKDKAWHIFELKRN